MKRTNKKGFTIVELVVVIAVIAVLATVMIPTFSGVTGKAKDAAALSDAKAVYTQYIVDHPDADAATIYVMIGTQCYKVDNGVAAKYTIPTGKTTAAIECDADTDHANCAKVVTIVDAQQG